ncbi:quinol-cytochrome c reductase, fused cytochrome b/c subunit [Fimbriimonas ginsengisoli Gsoil 348]|uniref:Quinol-cytochrome c reductase, fused cytochrome b/c subunit n=2 Tax=Fimbriimonas ginsengisoli TaxID=1005039 RepID=A0A068NK18_FIMGI|nr:quinol-cytochrome c reductase, fused cytochrome b/c subunit [Fimbriimonas ginsengisoli Gsoil 348]
MEGTTARTDRLLWSSGAGLALHLVLQLFAGLVLSFAYHGQPALAHSDVAAMHSGGGLRFLQGFHYWGSALLILQAALHVAASTWLGDFRPPNGRRYIGSLLILLAALGFQLTGNLLPYDRHGVQTAAIEAGIAARAPVVGPSMAKAMLGGNGFNEGTLGIWYSLHHLAVPVLALIAPAIWFAGRPRESSPARILLILPAALAASLAFAVPSPFGSIATPADFDAFADKVSWYVWPLHGAMRLFERASSSAGWIGAILLPGLLVGFLFLLPFIGKRISLAWVRGILAGAGLLLIVGALGFAGSFAPLTGTRDPVANASGSGQPATNIDKAMAERGRAAFNKVGCADCHGKDGASGSGGPTLTKSWQRHNDSDYYVRYIHNPQSVKPDSTMPAFPKLTDVELHELAEYLRSPKP